MSNKTAATILLAATLSLLLSFDTHADNTDADHVSAENLSEIVKVLASDEFEGRAPGTPGEEKTVEYLIDQFKVIGVEPGGDDGGWTQAVPLLHTQLEAASSFGFEALH